MDPTQGPLSDKSDPPFSISWLRPCNILVPNSSQEPLGAVGLPQYAVFADGLTPREGSNGRVRVGETLFRGPSAFFTWLWVWITKFEFVWTTLFGGVTGWP